MVDKKAKREMGHKERIFFIVLYGIATGMGIFVIIGSPGIGAMIAIFSAVQLIRTIKHKIQTEKLEGGNGNG